jgi:predicted RNA-binding protein
MTAEHPPVKPSGTYEYPAEVVLERAASWEKFRIEANEFRDEHEDFVNELLKNTPERYDGDDAAEHIAVTYVRDLEKALEISEEALSAIAGESTLSEVEYAKDELRKIREVTRRDNSD